MIVALIGCGSGADVAVPEPPALDPTRAMGELTAAMAAPARDAARILELARAACAGGFAAACTQAAVLLQDGTEVPADPETALALYDRACQGGDGWGCTNLGVMRKTAGDPERAQVAYRRACDLEDGVGCANAARLIVTGQIPGDEAQARTLLQRGCALGDAECCQVLGAPRP